MYERAGFRPEPRRRQGPKTTASGPLHDVRQGIGYGNEQPGTLCSHPIVARGLEPMKQSTVQMISFLVLGAIVLATGLGAIGGPAILAGGF